MMVFLFLFDVGLDIQVYCLVWCGLCEWVVCVKLVVCYCIFVQFGWIELIYNYIMLCLLFEDDSVDDGGLYFFINLFGLIYVEVCVLNFVKIDLQGNVQCVVG